MDAKKALILVVDDTLINRQLLGDILTEAGFSMYGVSSGREALRFVETTLPDLILLDVMMPDLDGYEVCRLLKVNERTNDIPVIFVSALNGTDDQIKGFAVGGVDYIVRPFRAKEVLARVETHLALQSLRRTLEEHVQARTRQMRKANARLQEEIAEREQTEKALARERNLLRSLIDVVPDHIFAKDCQGQFILANVAHATAANRGPDELIGKTAAEVFSADIAARFHQDDNEVMQTGKPLFNQERMISSPEGQPRWLLTTKIPLRDPRGEVIGLVGVSRDITERKEAQEALYEREQSYRTLYDRAVQQTRFTESLLSHLPVGVLLVTPEGVISETNQELRNMVGYTNEELKQQNIRLTSVEAHLHNDGAYFESVVDGRSSGPYETELRCKDGSLLKVRIRAARLQDGHGDLVGILATIEDISQQAIAEEAWRTAERLRIELEKEKELRVLKSRFVLMASHEFRTPLATIQATVDSLQNYFDRMSSDTRLQRFQKIRDQIKRVTTLLNDVLTIQEIDAETRDLISTDFDLNTFLEEIVNEYQKTNSGKTIEYTGTNLGNCLIRADKELFRHVIANLISNAIQYSSDDDSVQVDLSRDQNDFFVIRVTDTGIGIPKEEQKYLFSRFFRGSNTAGIPGTGLGLAIAKHAVEKHGGTIQAESEEGVGTTITVTIADRSL